MKRAGFTMIELIFVIVILGILAAVAVPKLAATRADASASAAIANWKTAVSQIQAEALATGTTPANLTTVVSPSATLLVAATTIRAVDDGNNTCALGTITGDTLVVSAVSTANNCVTFDSVIAETLNLAGTAVSR